MALVLLYVRGRTRFSKWQSGRRALRRLLRNRHVTLVGGQR